MSAVEPQARTIAIIAYLTLVGTLIAMSMNAEPKYAFGRFHTRQAFGLHLGFLACALFLSYWFNYYAWIGLYVGYFVLWIYGFTGALQSKAHSLPVLGPYFQKWFAFIP